MLPGHGITLDRSTLVHGIGHTAWWLRPLCDLLAGTIMAAGKVSWPGTPLPVLGRIEPGDERGSHNSRGTP